MGAAELQQLLVKERGAQAPPQLVAATALQLCPEGSAVQAPEQLVVLNEPVALQLACWWGGTFISTGT